MIRGAWRGSFVEDIRRTEGGKLHPHRKKKEKRQTEKKMKVPEEKTITVRNSAEDTWRLSVTRVVMAACQGRPSDGQ